MRIISGKYRAMKLAEITCDGVRPTSDRVKESLFNLLFTVSGKRCLDLFCGSGGFGLECISRGAEFVAFNDSSTESLKVLEKNLKRLKDEKGYRVTKLDYAAYLSGGNTKFDIIFLDPPYASESGLSALKLIAKHKNLSSDGVVVFECDRPFKGEAEGLEKFDERKYGKTYITFFKQKAVN